jgi:hypothetical protein
MESGSGGTPSLDVYTARQEICTAAGRWELKLHSNGEWDYTFYPVKGRSHDLAKGAVFSGILSVEFDRGSAHYPPPPDVLKSLRVLVELLYPQQGG